MCEVDLGQVFQDVNGNGGTSSELNPGHVEAPGPGQRECVARVPVPGGRDGAHRTGLRVFQVGSTLIVVLHRALPDLQRMKLLLFCCELLRPAT